VSQLKEFLPQEKKIQMKVLLTTDGSESAERAIRWFSRLPIEHNSSYEVMTVSSYQPYGMVPSDVHDEFVRLESARALQAFQRAERILREVEIEATHVACLGQVADQITIYAKESKVDLIVVGAHGMSFLEHMLLGSTSETVARHAPCSVLIVRDPHAKNFNSEPASITIASDGSDVDKEIAAQINALGVSNDTKFDLISVIEHPYVLEPGVEYDAQLTRETALILDRLAEELTKSSVHIEKHVFERIHIANCILNYVQKHPTDMLVLGDKGRSAIGRFFLGSVSRVLLNHAPCSVLLVRKRLE
jgi:nucleotide-binding universal stress UspA family protein